MKTIKAWFISHSVDAVLAVLVKTIARLQKVSEHHKEQGETKQRRVKTLLDEVESHVAEGVRADRVIEKLRALVE